MPYSDWNSPVYLYLLLATSKGHNDAMAAMNEVSDQYIGLDVKHRITQ